MLDEKAIMELILKLRARADKDPAAARDALEVLAASYREDIKEPALEIARTVCELLEPERMGTVVFIQCRMCNARLTEVEEQQRGTCSSCLLGT